MSAEEPPDWLPDGWIMEVRTTRRGGEHRYYISPLSRRTFRSRLEVLRYLNFEKFDDTSEETSHVGDSKHHLVPQREDSSKWLPSGWALEVKSQKSGEGQKYKSYIDPSSGSTFYSKGEVCRNLKNGKSCSSPSPNHLKSFITKPVDNVFSQFHYSPDGLPHGWIKEVKFRNTTLNKSGVRKDLYYIDPVNGYVFRSLRDVFRYIETGEVSKHASKRDKGWMDDMHSLENESSPPISVKKLKSQEGAPRRCLFLEQIPESNGETIMERDHSPEEPQTVSSVLSSQCVGDADLICSIPSRFEESNGEAREGGNKVLRVANKKLPESADTSKVKTKKGRRKILEPETSDPMAKKEPETWKQIPPDLSERKQLVADMKLSDLVAKKFSKLSERKRQKPTHKIPSEHQMDNEKNLKLENGRLPIPEVKLLMPQNEKFFVAEENLVNPENMLLVPEEQQSQSECMSDLGVKNHESRTTKAQKAISVPLGAFNRLTGIEADCVTDLGRSHRVESMLHGELEDTPAKDSNSCNQLEEALEDPERKDTPGEQVALGEQAGVGKPADDGAGLPLTSPFEDPWPHQCIDFASKNRTEVIPVLDDSLVMEEYFQQELVSPKSSSPNGMASLPSDSTANEAEPHTKLIN